MKSKPVKIKGIIHQGFKIGLDKLTEQILVMRYGHGLSFSELKRQMYGFRINQKVVSSKRLYVTMERMKKQGWLEKKVIADQLYYFLTAKGKVKQLLFILRRQQRQRGDRATIIIFDIPEEKRTFRNFLRRLLKQMNFTMIQKSVFITPQILPREFYLLLKEVELLQYIRVIEGELRYPQV